ncbi:hypothetical protein BOTCAL_0460g00090 [Botryotinia calthae]|uniref:Uncharacterized protein n=1 Tax=Botryotinia calthae TaxID=38488 RepID=A0A4Y8CQH4_9HELO|nr:hypothetical protein BOTCAL_0460g00090 [Botryotinia calthae]
MKNGDEHRKPNPHGGTKGDDGKYVYADSVDDDKRSQRSTQTKETLWDGQKGSERGNEEVIIEVRDTGKPPGSIKDDGRDGNKGKADNGRKANSGSHGFKDDEQTLVPDEEYYDSQKAEKGDGKKSALSSADKNQAHPLKDIQEDFEGSEELDLQRADAEGARRSKNSATFASDTTSMEPEKPKRRGEYTSKPVPRGAKVLSLPDGFARKPRPGDARVSWLDPKVKVDREKRARDWGYDKNDRAKSEVVPKHNARSAAPERRMAPPISASDMGPRASQNLYSGPALNPPSVDSNKPTEPVSANRKNDDRRANSSVRSNHTQESSSRGPTVSRAPEKEGYKIPVRMPQDQSSEESDQDNSKGEAGPTKSITRTIIYAKKLRVTPHPTLHQQS